MSDDHSRDSFDLQLDNLMGALEEILNDKGLEATRQRFPYHPAVRRFDALRHIRQHHGVPYPEEVFLRRMAEAFFDSLAWLRPDVLKTVASDEAIDRLRQLAGEPNRFDDVTAELYVAGRLADSGLSARSVDIPSRPDIQIVGPVGEVWAEVKRVHLGSVVNRAEKDLGKANRQLRSAGATAGLVVIFVERDGSRASTDDRIPSDVRSYVDRLEHALVPGKNRNVARVVVIWDDFLVEADTPGHSFTCFRRRSEILDHPEPWSWLPESIAGVEFGASFVSTVSWGKAPAGSLPVPPERSSIRVAPLFREQCELVLGIRASEAIETLCEPDDLETLSGSPSNLVLAIRDKGNERALLVLANETSGTYDLLAGFRVRTSPGSGLSPLAVLKEMLAACGLPVRAAGREDIFIEHVNVPVVPGESLLGGFASDGPGMIFMVLRLNEGNPTTADLSWVFNVSVDRYRQYAQRA